MEATPLVERLEGLAPVTLAELGAVAPLLTRRDRKYLVPLPVAERLLAELPEGSRVLDIDGRRRFRYESVYFDTPAHDSYLLAARRRPRRYKVRTRAYLDTGRCVLEIKTRDGRGRTVKTQHAHPLDRRDRLDPGDRAVVGAYPLIGDRVIDLEQSLTTRYVRATLLLPGGAARATLDTDLITQTPDGRLAALPGMAIVESKSAGAPSPVDRLLWAMGHRPITVSKFCTGLAALQPDLPSNRWKRALGGPWSVREARVTPAALAAAPA